MDSVEKKLLSMVLFFVCLGFVFSGSAYAEMVEYSNQYFSLEHPADWAVAEFGTEFHFDDGEHEVLTIEIVEPGYGLAFNFDTSGLDSDEFVEKLQEDLEEQEAMRPESLELSTEEREISGLNALEMITREEDELDGLFEVYWDLELLAIYDLEVVVDYLDNYTYGYFAQEVTLEELAELEEILMDVTDEDMDSYQTEQKEVISDLLERLDVILAADSLIEYHLTHMIMTIYDDHMFFIFYEGGEEEYEALKPDVEQVVESLEIH